MKEGFEPTMKNPETPEQKLRTLPDYELEKILKSWAEIRKLVELTEKLSVENADAAKVENRGRKSNLAISREIYDFYFGLFEGEENADPMQIEIGLTNHIVDTYLARDEGGKIISILQSQVIEMPPEEEGGKPELVFLVWYVATSPEYKGRPLIRDLFRLALSDLLKKAQTELKAIKGLAGETEDEVEGLFNRYGLRRLYYRNREGKIEEVPFESPPEDESGKGVPEHLMLKLLDSRETMSVEELIRFVQIIYDQYTRPEYFSVEYLKYAQKFYGEEGQRINSVTANVFRLGYLKVVAAIRKKLEGSLKPAAGPLFFMSRQDRRKLTGGPEETRGKK